ncbi:MAG: SRPBCC family protein [Rhizobiaceae bacterium]|nr:SRPBCC family protein [Rhizobiaceae bacterium]
MNAYGTFTAPDTVRIERLLPGPIERVWAYLTESDKRGRWLSSGDMDLRPGGQVEHVFRNSELTLNDDPAPAKYQRHAGAVTMGGEITACEQFRLLAYRWGTDANASHVTFELTPQNDKVLLVVTHRQIASRDNLLGFSAGWHTHLDILADRLEGREPPGFWKTHGRLVAEYESRMPAA